MSNSRALGAAGERLHSVTGDRVAIHAAQVADARVRFGITTIRNSALSLPYALKLVRYWADDAAKVEDQMTSLLSAHTEKWHRDVFRLGELESRLESYQETDFERLTGVLHDGLADEVWATIDPVYIAASAIADTPGAWDILIESIEEAVHELPKTLGGLPIIGNIIKWTAIALAAIVVIKVAD